MPDAQINQTINDLGRYVRPKYFSFTFNQQLLFAIENARRENNTILEHLRIKLASNSLDKPKPTEIRNESRPEDLHELLWEKRKKRG